MPPLAPEGRQICLGRAKVCRMSWRQRQLGIFGQVLKASDDRMTVLFKSLCFPQRK
jgi:hypothetical protein